MKSKKLSQLKSANKLYKLIRIALADLELAEKSKKYEVDMGSWHTKDPETGKCRVCLAGSCLINVIPPGKYANPTQFDDWLEYKLFALNQIRCGNIRSALFCFYKNNEKMRLKSYRLVIPKRISGSFTQYEANPDQFKKWLVKVADWLETL